MRNSITHLKHSEIDFAKWDNLIAKSICCLPYAKSWFLNIVSPNWEALVLGDYHVVMPLPKRKKIGLKYFSQPIYTQQLGIFSQTETRRSIVEDFIKNLPFATTTLNLNSENRVNKSVEKPNYILNLNRDYQKIKSEFSKNTIRNIEKSRQNKIEVSCGTQPQRFLDFYFKNSNFFDTKNKKIVEKIVNIGFQKSEVKIFEAKNGDNNYVAGVALLVSEGRIIYFLPASSSEGKQHSAMFAIINNIIYQNSGKDIVFDFEGSETESIARFYRGFGAVLCPYYQIKKRGFGRWVKQKK